MPDYLYTQKLLKADARQRISYVRQKQRVHAPDFPEGFRWLNAAPLRMRDLRGKVLLLDFWAYSCINCLHTLPDLHYLEKKYTHAPFAVVSVHTGNFEHEQDPDNVKDAVLRHDVDHPVVIDESATIWQAYGLRAWPTMVLIDPEGYIIATLSGEGNRAILEAYIDAMLDIFSSEFVFDSSPLPMDPEKNYQYSQPLRYPAGILADSARQRLFIADTGHHRILQCDLQGRICAVIGSGIPGWQDGAYAVAQFQSPQGIALSGQCLFVADTSNHRIRMVDLSSQQVSTVAGNGEQARPRTESGEAIAVPLSSPRDVHAVENALYIAMAGSHQIWQVNLQTRQASPLAGTGREGARDGSFTEAIFAQPGAITGNGDSMLYVCDSESNRVRVIDLSDSTVGTLVETPDPPATAQRPVLDNETLQHPLGVAISRGTVYVSDSFNNTVKYHDDASNMWKELTIRVAAGASRRPTFSLNEPRGLSAGKNMLYIADTNNNQIRCVNLISGTWSTLPLGGMAEALELHQHPAMLSRHAHTEDISLPVQRLTANHSGTLQLRIQLPGKHRFKKGSPFEFVLRVTANVLDCPTANEIQSLPDAADLLNFNWKTGESGLKTRMTLELKYYYCSSSRHSVCLLRSAIYRIPVTLVPAGKTGIHITDEPR